MLIARKSDAQFQKYNRYIHKICLEEISLLLPKCGEPNGWKRGIIGSLSKVIVDNGSEAVSAFIRQRKSEALHKALLAMSKQHNSQVNRLEYSKEAMTLYGMYSIDSS